MDAKEVKGFKVEFSGYDIYADIFVELPIATDKILNLFKCYKCSTLYQEKNDADNCCNLRRTAYDKWLLNSV